MGWRENMGVKTENERFEGYEQKPQKEQKGGTGGSFATIATIGDKGGKIKSISEEEFYFEERAAIMEFDGRLSREDAERQAKRSSNGESSTVKKW